MQVTDPNNSNPSETVKRTFQKYIMHFAGEILLFITLYDMEVVSRWTKPLKMSTINLPKDQEELLVLRRKKEC